MTTMSAVRFSRINFYFTIFVSNLTMLGLGTAYAWTSPTLPILMSGDSVFPINQNEASWIASLFSLGAAAGPFLGNPIKEAVGFKWTFFVMSVLYATSWAALSFTWSIYVFYFARFLAGISAGMNFCIMPIYIGEITEDSLRSTVNSLPNLFRCLAFLQEYSVGPFVPYYVLVGVSAMPSLFQIILTPWLSESPYHLMAKGKKEDALETVKWLRGGIPTESAQVVTTQITTFLQRTKDNNNAWKDLLSTRANMKGLFISVTLLFLQQSSGLVVMIMYTKQMFDLTGTNISSSMSSILFGTVYLIGAAVGPLLIKKYGVKKPLLLSALGILVSEGILGVYLYFNAHSYDVSSFFWCPVACIATYAITYNIGLGPLPAALIGEIFPANVKVQASAISMSLSLVFGFVVSKFFPTLVQILGTHIVFWMFSSTGILLILVTVLYVPETKGLSLNQIQDLLSKNKRSQKKFEDIFVITV